MTSLYFKRIRYMVHVLFCIAAIRLYPSDQYSWILSNHCGHQTIGSDTLQPEKIVMNLHMDKKGSESVPKQDRP